jgi:hypothetical protein
LREWLVSQLQGSTNDDAPAAFFRVASARSEKIEFTVWAQTGRSLRLRTLFGSILHADGGYADKV